MGIVRFEFEYNLEASQVPINKCMMMIVVAGDCVVSCGQLSVVSRYGTDDNIKTVDLWFVNKSFLQFGTSAEI